MTPYTAARRWSTIIYSYQHSSYCLCSILSRLRSATKSCSIQFSCSLSMLSAVSLPSVELLPFRPDSMCIVVPIRYVKREHSNSRPVRFVMASNIHTGLHFHKHSQQRIEVRGENLPWRTGGHCFLVVLVVCLFVVHPIFPLACQAALLRGWRPPTYVTQPRTGSNNVPGIRTVAA